MGACTDTEGFHTPFPQPDPLNPNHRPSDTCPQRRPNPASGCTRDTRSYLKNLFPRSTGRAGRTEGGCHGKSPLGMQLGRVAAM